MFPTFKINQVVKAEKGLELTGVISSDSFDGHKWVDDKWVGALMANDSMVFGRWHKQDGDWKFAVDPEEVSKAGFSAGQEVELIDGYWSERIEVVIDKSIEWIAAAYAGDDHEHCLICWATISEFENSRYMLANERTAVCLNCFETYVKQGDFDFITYPKQ